MVQKGSSGRFSLLLLEEGEYYIKECVVECAAPPQFWGEGGIRPLVGELRLCTKSLFFEPDDVRVPIVRIPFLDIQELEGISENKMRLTASRWATMKPYARDEPYIFYKGVACEWVFALSYCGLGSFLPNAQEMLLYSRMPRTEMIRMQEKFIQDMKDRHAFDIGSLKEYHEKILIEKSATFVSQLSHEAGTFAATKERIYFHPLCNVSGSEPVRWCSVSEVKAVVRRRYMLQELAVELYLSPRSGRETKQYSDDWKGNNLFLVFDSEEDREDILRLLLDTHAEGERFNIVTSPVGSPRANGPLLHGKACILDIVTTAWVHGFISNFDYLLYCNLVADRSFNDLAQYPIFPWVVIDFTSPKLDLTDPNTFRDLTKPIGAINPDRLKVFLERYQEMESLGEDAMEKPFMFGTHYSCPGYTLFWLVRAMPAHMLRLQNGKFDAPDRCFNSISEAWESVYNNPADVKELIPEFFMPECDKFLTNQHGLALGVRQDGRPVSDVELPPWSKGIPHQFLEMHLKALESPYVSANLHHWIDLIFGIKQRGEESKKANNVFRQMTYEGEIDLGAIHDDIERAGIETAISEFGQCPRQIFSNPHPRRISCQTGNQEHNHKHRSFFDKIVIAVENNTQVEQQQARDDLQEFLIAATEQSALHTNQDITELKQQEPKAHAMFEKWESLKDISRKVMESSKKKATSSLRGLGLNSNESSSFSPRNMAAHISGQLQRLSPAKYKHDRRDCSNNPFDRCYLNETVLLTGDSLASLDFHASSGKIGVADHKGGVCIVNSRNGSLDERIRLSKSPVSCISWLEEDNFAAGSDEHVYFANLSTGIQESFPCHSDALSCIKYNFSEKLLYTAAWDGMVKAWDATTCFETKQSPNCISSMENADGSVWSMDVLQDNVIVAGSEEGTLSLLDFRSGKIAASTRLCSDYIGGICRFKNESLVATACADGIFRILDIRNIKSIAYHKKYDIPLTCCVASSDWVLFGAGDGVVRALALPDHGLEMIDLPQRLKLPMDLRQQINGIVAQVSESLSEQTLVAYCTEGGYLHISSTRQ